MTPDLGAFERLLSAGEKDACARRSRADDRARFVVARGLVRWLLGRQLHCDPVAIAFTAGPGGKPELGPVSRRQPIAFNLSHSGDAVVLALTAGARVGIDVEAVRPDLDVMEVAAHHFSGDEIAALAGLTGPARTAAFFQTWTRKEAYLKARGEGLAIPLRNFTVAVGPGDTRGLRWAADDPDAGQRWTVLDLAPAAGYAGAVVVERGHSRLVSHTWPAVSPSPAGG